MDNWEWIVSKEKELITNYIVMEMGIPLEIMNSIEKVVLAIGLGVTIPFPERVRFVGKEPRLVWLFSKLFYVVQLLCKS